jgi:hypothetical protein
MKHADGASRRAQVDLPLQDANVDVFEKLKEVDAAKVDTERFADPGARKTEAKDGRVDTLENEGVGQVSGDTRGLDFEPFRREAFASKLIPVGIERLADGFFHEANSPPFRCCG